MNGIKVNKNLNAIFKFEDHRSVAEVLIKEMSMNKIALTVQYKKKHKNYIDAETDRVMIEVNRQLKVAIEIN